MSLPSSLIFRPELPFTRETVPSSFVPRLLLLNNQNVAAHSSPCLTMKMEWTWMDHPIMCYSALRMSMGRKGQRLTSLLKPTTTCLGTYWAFNLRLFNET